MFIIQAEMEREKCALQVRNIFLAHIHQLLFCNEQHIWYRYYSVLVG